MAGRYSYYGDEEFDEEDVWAVVKDDNINNKAKPSPASTLRRIPTASKKVPRATISEAHKVQQQSAPVNVPDWSKIYKNNSSFCSWEEEGADDGRKEKKENEEEWIPPHEWLARKLARTQISSFSVCEGAGRTLKGRDLSKVRNAVLSRTGFLE